MLHFTLCQLAIRQFSPFEKKVYKVRRKHCDGEVDLQRNYQTHKCSGATRLACPKTNNI